LVGVCECLALEHGQKNLFFGPHGVLWTHFSESVRRPGQIYTLTGFFALALLSLSLHSSALKK
jgi:hypothetical protein